MVLVLHICVLYIIFETYIPSLLARKLVENCCKYGTESQSSVSPLSRAALEFGVAHGSVEDGKEAMLGTFVDKVIFLPITFVKFSCPIIIYNL